MTADARVRMPARRRSHRLATAALAACALAAFAPASTLASPSPITTPEVSASIPVTPTDWSPGFPPGLADPLAIPKFDSTLGKLLSVNVEMNYSIKNDFSMNFISPAEITVGATQTKIVVERPDKSVIAQATPADVSRSSSISGPSFPKGVTFPTLNRSGTTGFLTLNSAADLAMFTAAKKGDTLALPVMATAQSTFSSSTGNGSGVVNTVAGANVVVTYTYAPAPVPEPATIAVLGAGVLGLIVSRRTRR